MPPAVLRLPMSHMSPVPMASTRGAQPGLLQPLLDRRGGAELLVAELGVHVQVAPERDEFGAQRLGERAGKLGFPGGGRTSDSRDINWFTL